MPSSAHRKRSASAGRQSAVAAEIRHTKPFRSTAQEATIALLRTASVVNRALARVLESSGLSLPQYNALRIIRGAGSGGIPTLAIRERMIEEGTTITRLLDKLEEARLIRRERSYPDRRQVICHATAGGAKLLDALDPAMDAADEAAMDGLRRDQLEPLIDALDAIRSANAERGAPRTAVAREAGALTRFAVPIPTTGVRAIAPRR